VRLILTCMMAFRCRSPTPTPHSTSPSAPVARSLPPPQVAALQGAGQGSPPPARFASTPSRVTGLAGASSAATSSTSSASPSGSRRGPRRGRARPARSAARASRRGPPCASAEWQCDVYVVSARHFAVHDRFTRWFKFAVRRNFSACLKLPLGRAPAGKLMIALVARRSGRVPADRVISFVCFRSNTEATTVSGASLAT